MTYAYRRQNGKLIRRLAKTPDAGELVAHTGKQPRRRLSRRPVVLGIDNKPIRTPLILHKGKAS
jgi:hypothetical protein